MHPTNPATTLRHSQCRRTFS